MRLLVNQTVEAVSSFRILGIQSNDKPNFNLYVINICKSISNQLNTL